MGDAPADAIGTPAMSTTVQQDNLVVHRVAGGTLGTTKYPPMSADMTSAPAAAETMSLARPELNPQYPTRAGRFLTSGARSLRLHMPQDYPGAGLLTLDSPDTLVADPTTVSTTTAAAGQTLNLTLGPYTMAASTDPQSPAPVLADIPTGDTGLSAQWTLIESPDQPGWFSLRNRADGLCLDVENNATAEYSPLDTWWCTGQPNQLFQFRGSQGSLHPLSASGMVVDVGGAAHPYHAILRPTPSFATTAVRLRDPAGADPIPTWADSEDYTVDSPLDLATGDLDRARDSTTDAYHDEAAMVTVNGGTLNVRVVDYNANSSHLLVTSLPAGTTMPYLMDTVGYQGRPGAVNTAIGDFDGDGRNEIAVTYQDNTTNNNFNWFNVMFFRYTVEPDGTRSLALIHENQTVFQPSPDFGLARVAGNASLAVGQFDHQPKDELALAYVDAANVPGIAVATFNTDLSTQYRSAKQLLDTVVAAPATNDSYTTRGPQLRSGLFNYNTSDGDVGEGSAADGFWMGRRQLAVAFTPQYPVTPCGGGCPVSVKVREYEVTTPADNTSQDSSTPVAITALSDFITLPDTFGDELTPIGMTVGGFGSQQHVGDAVPWGVAVTAWAPSGSTAVHGIQVLTPNGKEGPRRTLEAHPVGNVTFVPQNEVMYPVAVDEDDRSLRLGAPVAVDVPNYAVVHSAVAAPVTHADWFPGTSSTAGTRSGTWSNISRNNASYITVGSSSTSTSTSTTTTTVGHAMGFSLAESASASYTAGVPDISTATVGVSEAATLDKNTTHSTATVNSRTATVTTSFQSTGNDDDLVVIDYQSFRMYRYPVLGVSSTGTCGPANNQTGPQCHPYYEVTVPTALRTLHTTGRAVDGFAPPWQNGNALSYPLSTGTGTVPDTDPAAYVQNGVKAPPGSFLNTTEYTNKDAVNTVVLDLVSGSASSSVSTVNKTWNASASINASAKVATAIGPSFTVDASAKFLFQHDDLSSTGTSNTDTSDSSFTLHADELQPNSGFNLATAVYYQTGGIFTVRHAVDFTPSATTGAYWQQYYAQQDLAWNLPGLVDTVQGGANNDYSTVAWDPYPYRQNIRGFSVTTPAGVILADPPTAGSMVQFTAPLHNYSVGNTSDPTTVTFYAVPLIGDDSTPDFAHRAQIGDPVPVGPIDPGGSVPVASSPWQAPNGTAGTSTDYRIFLVADADNSLLETHELGGDGTAVCPVASIDTPPSGPNSPLTPDGFLVDPMTGAKETLDCGQNNQGYGVVTVFTPGLGAPAGNPAAKVTTAGARIETGRPGGPVKNTDGATHVVEGTKYHGDLLVTTTAASSTRQPVIIYDGDPSAGNVIATTTLAAASAGRTTAVPYLWRAKNPGEHVLHLVLLSADGQSEQVEKHTLIVDAAPVVTPTPTPTPTPTTTPTSEPTTTPTTGTTATATAEPTTTPTTGTSTGTASETSIAPTGAQSGKGAGPGAPPQVQASRPAPGGSGPLANTGANGTAVLLWSAAALIALGVLLTLARRRRSPAQPGEPADDGPTSPGKGY